MTFHAARFSTGPVPAFRWSPFARPQQATSTVCWMWWALGYGVTAIAFAALFHAKAVIFVWPPNGILLAGLLLHNRADAIRLTLACLGISLAVHYALYPSPLIVVTHSALDILAPMAAAVIARRVCGAALDLGRPRRLLAFATIAVIPVCFAKALLETALSPIAGVDMLETAYVTLIVDAFGMLLIVPAAVQWSERPSTYFAPSRSWLETLTTMAFTVMVALTVLQLERAPLLFLMMIPVLLAALRLSIRATLLAVTLATTIIAIGTLYGHGPITLANVTAISAHDLTGNPIGTRWSVLQLFTAAMIGVALAVSATATEQRRTNGRLDRRIGTMHNALLSVQTAKQQVLHDALHDHATGLLNRGGMIRAIGCAPHDAHHRP